LKLYSARGRATGTRNAPVRGSSSGGKALVHGPFFLSLSSRPCPLRPLFPLPFPWGIRRGMCACKFAADRNFKPERISLYREVIQTATFRNCPQCARLLFSQVRGSSYAKIILPDSANRPKSKKARETRKKSIGLSSDFYEKAKFFNEVFLVALLRALCRLKLCSGFKKLMVYIKL